MFLNIQENAIFVADAHYNEKNSEFLTFLEKLQSKEIQTKQLFLMGDIFDFICSQSKYFVNINQELIDIINELSKEIEVIYLEGNHDYNLKPLFNNVIIYKRSEQPINAKYKNKMISLAHGDIFTPWHYNLYCAIIRNKPLLWFLNKIDINNFISKKIYFFLLEKSICSKMKDFDSFAKKRLQNYNSDIIIEGHFHQGKSYDFQNKTYVNIPSLCCEKKYFVLEQNFFKDTYL
jgi:UDP-2,3-diacylglucosamine hydrolase